MRIPKQGELSLREWRIARMLAEGRPYQMIGVVLGISMPTVRREVGLIYKAFSVKGRQELESAFTKDASFLADYRIGDEAILVRLRMWKKGSKEDDYEYNENLDALANAWRYWRAQNRRVPPD